LMDGLAIRLRPPLEARGDYTARTNELLEAMG